MTATSSMQQSRWARWAPVRYGLAIVLASPLLLGIMRNLPRPEEPARTPPPPAWTPGRVDHGLEAYWERQRREEREAEERRKLREDITTAVQDAIQRERILHGDR